MAVGANTLIDARCALLEANKQSLEVAEMSPEIAGELMNTDAIETRAFKKLETDILVKGNGFKNDLYPHLSPAPVHAPETGGAATTATTATKVGLVPSIQVRDIQSVLSEKTFISELLNLIKITFTMRF